MPGTEHFSWQGQKGNSPYRWAANLRGAAHSPRDRTKIPEVPMPAREVAARPALPPSSPISFNQPFQTAHPFPHAMVSHTTGFYRWWFHCPEHPPFLCVWPTPPQEQESEQSTELGGPRVQGSRVPSAWESRAVGKLASGLTVGRMSSGSPGARIDLSQDRRGLVARADLADSLGCGGAGGHRAQLCSVGCGGGWNCSLFLGS